MIRDITIGQYYPAQSPIHRLDPRVKIVCTLIFLVSLFVQNSVLGYALAFVFLACMIHVSKVPAKFIGKGLKPIVILLLFTVAMNLFLTRGGAVLFHWGIITITETGLRTSVFMAVRLVLLVAGSSLMTFTTTPNGLTDGLEKLLHPLNRIHVPVHEISMMMSIALRFIPILLEETDKIMKAQIARGADFECRKSDPESKGNDSDSGSAVSFLRSEERMIWRWRWKPAVTTVAEGRTKMKPLKYHYQDRLAYAITLGYLIAIVVIGRFVPFKLWIF